MNITKKNKAFTLVELIVVITILAVLATIAFISFQGYAASSRDSVRLADMKSMEKVNAIFKQTTGKYPIPNDNTSITYSGSTAWMQGVFGQNSYGDMISMSNVPTDPLTQLPYAYSVTNTRQEYQMATVLENTVSLNLNSQTYAGDQVANVYVKGDYNGKIIKVRKDTTDYILGVPSIIASDINDVRLETILTNQKLVYKGYSNLPASYSGSIYDSNPVNGFLFPTDPNQVILFEGDIDNLENSLSARVDFLDNLQTNYSGSIIAGEGNIAEILAVDSSSNKGSNYVATVLNNNLNTKIAVVEVEKKLTLEDIKILVEEATVMVNNLSIIAGNNLLSSASPSPTVELSDGPLYIHYGFPLIVNETNTYWRRLIDIGTDFKITNLNGVGLIYETALESMVLSTGTCAITFRNSTGINIAPEITLHPCL